MLITSEISEMEACSLTWKKASSQMQTSASLLETLRQHFELLACLLLTSKLTQDLQTKDAELQGKATELQEKTTELLEKDVELQKEKDKLQERHTELQEKQAELQENNNRLKATEEQRKVFEEQLQREVESFCILPPRPPHVIASRDSDVARVSQKLTTLRKANRSSFFVIFQAILEVANPSWLDWYS